MNDIAQYTTKDDVICSDTGTALGYLMQGFPFKGERFIHAFNMTPMGYGLPAAIGAALATQRRVLLVTGDGSLMMSLPELATVARWNLNIKIILLNNKGHAMCRQTQRQWLGGSYPATSIEGGLGFPDFSATAEAFGIPVREHLHRLFSISGPCFHEVDIHPDAQLIPQARYGQPLEDADPQLPREEFLQQMIVPPL
jgi:acetolactate synthase I/II/III large subunit